MTGASYDPAAASHRALRTVRHELGRHPAVVTARGFPSGEHTRVVADLAPNRLGITAEGATVTVRWFAGEQPDSEPEFSVHYSDGQRDFGWHHEPNPHVDGMGHFQRRTDPESDYSYEPYQFASKQPARVVWEVLSALSAEIES